jgi:sensor histidine kinase YesM
LVVYIPMIGISCVPLIEYDWDLWPAFNKIFFWQYIYLRYLVVDIAFSYMVAYYLIPRYIPKKSYTAFSIRVAALLCLAYLLSGLIVIMQFSGFREPFLLDLWKHTQTFVNSGPVVRCALFLFALALKNYYVQVEQRIELLRETASAELQLLKAQVHPHFLFNTLNNIFSFMLTRSPLAGRLLDKLSTTMHYMITDCETPVVALKKEVSMLQDYIGLEKVRYGSRLQIQVNFPDNTEKYMVAPLLLIPFIENAFKHGASNVLEGAWIVVEMDVRKGRLHFLVSNSKPPKHAPCAGKSGIGLKNARKRLELLYGKQYVLNVEEEEEKFTVRLEIPVGRHVAVETEQQAGNAPAELLFS